MAKRGLRINGRAKSKKKPEIKPSGPCGQDAKPKREKSRRAGGATEIENEREVTAMAKDYKKTKAFRELRASMADSLESRGLIQPVYTELLHRYLDLWCEYQDLTDDIKERGVVVMDEKRGMLVENRSLTIRHQTSNKMLDIYAALGFRDISAPRAGPKANGVNADDEL